MILDKKHAMQQKLFRQFAETEFTKELQEELDTTGAFNWDIHNKMAKYGFMGVKIPGALASGSRTVDLRKHIELPRRRPSAACRKRRAEKRVSASCSKRREDPRIRTH